MKQAFLLLLLPFYCFSQTPSIQWARCFGGTDWDEAYGILQLEDGSFIVSGVSFSTDGDVNGNHGLEDMWIIKIDSLGNLIWQKCLGGTLGESARAMKRTYDGGIILAGYASSIDGDVTGGGNHFTSDDYWLVKIDTAANILWQHCYGGSSVERANNVCQTRDSGYVIVGSADSFDFDVTGNHGNGDIWLVKTDSIGNLQWQRCLGSLGSELGTGVNQLSNGDIVVTGEASMNGGDVNGSHGDSEGWVVKLSETGNLIWQHCYGGIGADNLLQMEVGSNSDMVFIGASTLNDGDITAPINGPCDAIIIVADTGSSLLDQKSYGGLGSDVGDVIARTSDHGFILGNETSSNDSIVMSNNIYDYYVVKIDSMYSQEWYMCMGGSMIETPHAIMQARDGGYMIAGSTDSQDGDVIGHHGNFMEDFWVVRLTAAGVQVPVIEPAYEFNCFLDHEQNLHIHIEINENPQSSVQVMDITGRLILQQDLSISPGITDKVLDLKNLASDVYVVRLITSNGILTRKIIKP